MPRRKSGIYGSTKRVLQAPTSYLRKLMSAPGKIRKYDQSVPFNRHRPIATIGRHPRGARPPQSAGFASTGVLGMFVSEGSMGARRQMSPHLEPGPRGPTREVLERYDILV